MPLELWLAYVATSVVVLAIPGPTILLVLSYSISQGRSATLPLVAGVAVYRHLVAGRTLPDLPRHKVVARRRQTAGTGVR